jgi:hypothetical protein
MVGKETAERQVGLFGRHTACTLVVDLAARQERGESQTPMESGVETRNLAPSGREPELQALSVGSKSIDLAPLCCQPGEPAPGVSCDVGLAADLAPGIAGEPEQII